MHRCLCSAPSLRAQRWLLLNPGSRRGTPSSHHSRLPDTRVVRTPQPDHRARSPHLSPCLPASERCRAGAAPDTPSPFPSASPTPGRLQGLVGSALLQGPDPPSSQDSLPGRLFQRLSTLLSLLALVRPPPPAVSWALHVRFQSTHFLRGRHWPCFLVRKHKAQRG